MIWLGLDLTTLLRKPITSNNRDKAKRNQNQPAKSLTADLPTKAFVLCILVFCVFLYGHVCFLEREKAGTGFCSICEAGCLLFLVIALVTGIVGMVLVRCPEHS